MTIKTETQTFSLYLRQWTPGSGFGPNCIDDLAEGWRHQYPHDPEDDSIILIPNEEMQDHFRWWAEEVDRANDGLSGDLLEPLEDGMQWVFEIDNEDLDKLKWAADELIAESEELEGLEILHYGLNDEGAWECICQDEKAIYAIYDVTGSDDYDIVYVGSRN